MRDSEIGEDSEIQKSELVEVRDSGLLTTKEILQQKFSILFFYFIKKKKNFFFILFYSFFEIFLPKNKNIKNIENFLLNISQIKSTQIKWSIFVSEKEEEEEEGEEEV